MVDFLNVQVETRGFVDVAEDWIIEWRHGHIPRHGIYKAFLLIKFEFVKILIVWNSMGSKILVTKATFQIH